MNLNGSVIAGFLKRFTKAKMDEKREETAKEPETAAESSNSNEDGVKPSPKPDVQETPEDPAPTSGDGAAIEAVVIEEGSGKEKAPEEVEPAAVTVEENAPAPVVPEEVESIPSQEQLEEVELEPETEMMMEQDSIIEMEVDDSNTGDTITSNPEIDLGSAAAAATAVIMEDHEHEQNETSGGVEDDDIDSSGPIIVSTSSASQISLTLGPILMKAKAETQAQQQQQPPSEQEVKREVEPPAPLQHQFQNIKIVPDEESSSSPVVVATEDTPSSPPAEAAEPEGESLSMDMEITDTPAEPDVIVQTTEPISFDPTTDTIEMTETGVEHEVERSQDHGFLNEEESMQSMPGVGIDPEDGGDADVDKENNLGLPLPLGVEGDGDEDNDNDDETYLEITRRRISQDREGNCYCGKDRNFNIAELYCVSCYRWFHESCISYQLGKLVPFTTNYIFRCKNCSPTGLESFKRNQAQFSQMCVTALANLTQSSIKDGTNIKRFSKDKDIIPFFEMHWEALTTTRRMTQSQSWQATVSKTLFKDAGPIYSVFEVAEDENSPYFGLVSDDLTQIRPNYDAMIKSGQLKVTDGQRNASSLRGRGAKRRTLAEPAPGQNQMLKKPRTDMYGLSKPIVGHGYPAEHPYNKESYRYILAEPDPNAPFRQEFDESNEFSGKPIHGWLCRPVNPSVVLLALHDRAPQLKISDDRLSVTGEKGYCMIRATHGVTRGSWYFEAKITEMPEGSATRIGFSQMYGNLQGPLGFDRYGYSWRSRYGTVFHEARGKSYAKGGYGLGDVLGFLIVLPDEKNVPLVQSSMKDRPLVKVKSHLYYEDKDDPKDLERRDARKGSKIICFKNGVCQGVAYEDIYSGTYYPAVSLYKSVTVRVNFGPEFEAPPTDMEYRGFNERAESSIIEQTVADMLYLTENHGRLRLDNAVPMPV